MTESATHRLDEQQTLRRIATVVARQHDAQEVLALVTTEVARHLAADAAMTARYDGPGSATVLAEWSAPGVSHFPMGLQIDIGGPTARAQAQQSWAPARVDSYDGMPGDYPAELRKRGIHPVALTERGAGGRSQGTRLSLARTDGGRCDARRPAPTRT